MKNLWALLVLAVSLAACSSSKPDSSTDSSTIPMAPVQASSSTTESASAPSPDCPHNGKWALCGIERRLKQSGFVVKRVEGDTALRAGFSVRPAVYTLGRSTVAIFLYKDSAAVSRDVMKLDTLTAGPPGKPSQWGDTPPTLVRSANMAAVIISQSARQIERAINALTAGPPQAGSPR